MARNAIEIVVKVRDEASKEVALIFDQFGRNARELAAAADPSAQALVRVDNATKGATVSLTHATRAIRSVAVPLAGALSPALGTVAGEIISVAAHTATLTGGLAAVGIVAGSIAVVVGTALYEAFTKAAKTAKEFKDALASMELSQVEAQVKRLTLAINDLAEAREKARAQAAAERAVNPSAETRIGPLSATGQARRAQRAIEPLAADLARAGRITEAIKADQAVIEALRKDAESADATFKQGMEDQIKLVQARRELDRARITDQATLAAAEQDAAAKDIGRQTERALAGKAADAEMLESRHTLARAYAEILEQQAEGEKQLGVTVLGLISRAAEASRGYFAERARGSQEATAIQVAGIEQATTATLRGAQIQLEGIQKSLAALKAEPLFRGGQDAGMQGQAATLENQIKAQQQKITEIVRAGANERAKAEEEGLGKVRALRLQDAQQALQDLQKTIAAEKAARDQARGDAAGLLGEAAASLQGKGITFATGQQLQAEAALLVKAKQATLGALAGGRDFVDLSEVSGALSSMDQLKRLQAGQINMGTLGPIATEGAALSPIQQQIEREFLLSGRQIPKGGLFPEKVGPEVGAAQRRAQQAVDAATQPIQAGAKGLVDVVIQALGDVGEPQFIVLGQKFIKKIFEGATDKAIIGDLSDVIGRQIAENLLTRAQQSGF